MKEVVGRVFSIARDNEPIAGCTVSKEIYGGDNAISIFSIQISVQRYSHTTS